MNEIAKKAENGSSLDVMLLQAELFVKSGFFPKHVDTKEKALVIMLKGKELGLPFTEALGKIAVIQGVATTKVETLLGLARRTGQMEDFKQRFGPNEIAPQYCEVTIKRKGQSAHTCRFGDEEAASMGLTAKDNYKKQKATMYSWRAISKNLRVTFPDAIGGLYLEEEIADDVLITHTARPEVTETVQVIEESPKYEAKPQYETNSIPDDQLGNFVLTKGKYKDQRLLQIYGQQTENGKAVGAKYLHWVADKFQDENGEIVRRFLALMNKEAEIDMEE